MKTAVIIHGYNDKSEYLDQSRPAPSNDHWLPWIQRRLLLKGVLAQTPEMPGFYKPNYKKWKDLLEKLTPDENTILIGHSCGGGFLVRWLSETKIKVGKVVLVAPWLDPKDTLKSDFFKFNIDPNLVSKTESLTVMYSKDDFSDILKTIHTLKTKIKDAQFKEFSDKGHFVQGSMKTDKFPELLEILDLK